MMFTAFFLLSMLAALHIVAEAPRVVRLRTSRLKRNPLNERDHHSVTLGNAVSEGLYYVNASIGTPKQSVALQIDTGSSDVWVFGPGSCDARSSKCLGGDYDPSKSSTVIELGSGFNIHYVTPGSGIYGNYTRDCFQIGDMIIQNLTMAVATNARFVDTGIMGIGFDTDESLPPGVKIYPNIVDDMVDQGLINVRAYSLWLDDLDTSTGTVLFGGYDTEKYTGHLIALDLQPDAISRQVNTMTIAWTSLSIASYQGTTLLTPVNFAAPAVLDSGTSYIGLPTVIFEQIVNWIGVINDPNYGYLVRCNISSYQDTLDYGFGGSKGPVISVKYSEIAVPLYNEDGTQLTFTDGSYACAFGIFPVEDGAQILFGDTFLRSAYVVYDLASRQIALAPTNFNSTTSNVVEIQEGGVNVASSAAPSVTVAQTGTEVVGHYAMDAKTEGATVTATPLSGNLGALIASAANGTTASMAGKGDSTTSSATNANDSNSASAGIPIAVPAFTVVVACFLAMILLGGLLTGMA